MIIEDFIERKAGPHAEIIRQIHQCIMSAHPGIQNSWKYGLPFYSLKKNLFYFDVQKGKPLVAVYYGRDIKSALSLMDFTGRKQVGHFSLESMTDERFSQFFALIDAVIEFDLR